MVTPSWGTICPLASTAAPRLGLKRQFHSSLIFGAFAAVEDSKGGLFSPEGEITVLSEEAVARSNRTHCSQAETSTGVLRAESIENHLK